MATDRESQALAGDDGLGHRAVLLDEALEALAIRSDGRYVDCTFGRGGHSGAILARLGPGGRLLAIDRDPQAVAAGRAWRDPRFAIEHARFSGLDAALDAHGFERVDGVLLDLGVSSPQLDDPARGFSFREDGPLDMRMDPTVGVSAREWLLRATEGDIAKVVKDYGEERFAVQIAKAIVARRGDAGEQALRTTAELAALVAGVVRRRQGRAQVGKDPATRTFQALRIHVNQELEELALVLGKSVARLAQGGAAGRHQFPLARRPDGQAVHRARSRTRRSPRSRHGRRAPRGRAATARDRAGAPGRLRGSAARAPRAAGESARALGRDARGGAPLMAMAGRRE